MPANCGRRRESGGSGITRPPRFAPSRPRIEKVPRAGLAAQRVAEGSEELLESTVGGGAPEDEPGIAPRKDERKPLAADLVIDPCRDDGVGLEWPEACHVLAADDVTMTQPLDQQPAVLI